VSVLYVRAAAGPLRLECYPEAAVAPLNDAEIRDLLGRDPSEGWRAFVDRYTPVLLSLIERAGIRDYDEAMELYLNTCERLSADGCARLRRHDPGKGPVGAWLAVVVRNVIVDWVRGRAGRRRLFQAIEALPPRAQQVFEQYYWHGRTLSEITGILTMQEGRPVMLADVFDAMDAIDSALTERHRRELLAMSVRSTAPASLEAEMESGLDVPSEAPDPERALRAAETAAVLDTALRSLPSEDAAIVRLKYAHGLSHRDIQHALHLPELPDSRVKAIAARLRTLLAGLSDPSTAGGRT
jgi:DNA-directed RNA polymerase specialized sigma24 family protein